jgi:hypothetical protein
MYINDDNDTEADTRYDAETSPEADTIGGIRVFSTEIMVTWILE